MQLRILLVDDDPSMRRMLRRTLERAGYEVVGEAEEGSAAIEKARQLKPDVVLMDFNMPGMTGLQAAKAVKAVGADIEILFVSACEDRSLQKVARDAGAAGWILKGSDPAELLQALEDLTS